MEEVHRKKEVDEWLASVTQKEAMEMLVYLSQEEGVMSRIKDQWKKQIGLYRATLRYNVFLCLMERKASHTSTSMMWLFAIIVTDLENQLEPLELDSDGHIVAEPVYLDWFIKTQLLLAQCTVVAYEILFPDDSEDVMELSADEQSKRRITIKNFAVELFRKAVVDDGKGSCSADVKKMFKPVLCAHCKERVITKAVCGKCQKVHYCNAACQRKHWVLHRVVCQEQDSEYLD
jgi:hypothetical protein